MILKNLINLLNIPLLIVLLLILFIINKFINTSKIREKFFILLILIIIFSLIGFYYCLDGLVMLFLVSELSVILIFITLFSQIYSYNRENLKQNSLIFFILLSLINFNFYDYKIINYKSYYSNYSIYINDFYYIYNCYFEKQIILTIIILFIITLYSIFFILLYFNIKKNTNIKNNNKKNIFLLRKQNLIHQVNFNNKIRFFKNNNCFKKILFQYLVIQVEF